ncbi:uncharacterized protein METZ01_LOCUS446979 [marine metagenome]|uniref:Uncharacterized protein n=1 Tax=marine metagenome TaxID=408172 RepID=A0A382ZGA8_9ZZZZ
MKDLEHNLLYRMANIVFDQLTKYDIILFIKTNR